MRHVQSSSSSRQEQTVASPHESRVLIVTGASSGIGAATARAAVAAGWRVALAARRLALLEELVRAAGLAIEQVETFFAGIVKLVTARPSPHN